jgi:AcrR family transcriptional regulator
MRVRTDQKRREIVEAAAALFVEQGYERTSMSAIAERVGGSKATLYGYFRSKEELFRAVLEFDVAQGAVSVLHAFPGKGDLRKELIRLGIEYLTGRLADLPISNLVTLASQRRDSDMGRTFFAEVLKPAWQLLADRFAALMKDGHLRQADSWTVAMQWKGLTEGELLEKRLLGAIGSSDAKEIKRAATSAADALLRIYSA